MHRSRYSSSSSSSSSSNSSLSSSSSEEEYHHKIINSKDKEIIQISNDRILKLEALICKRFNNIIPKKNKIKKTSIKIKDGKHLNECHCQRCHDALSQRWLDGTLYPK